MGGMTHSIKLGLLSTLIIFAMVPFAFADHAWGSYHWARTQNPFSIKLGDNVTPAWDAYLRTAASDWSASSVLDVVVVSGTQNPKNCRATTGRGEVCNAKYGANGWLGIAQIYISGGHITAGVVKLNDTYFNTAKYNTSAWKNLVMCQEVGHIFGLAHQDENMTNANLGSCMDYTNLPASNQHPNQHDYDMLETIYAHLDSSTTIKQTTSKAPALAADVEDIHQWGKEVRRSADGNASLFARDLGNGNQVFTHVFWADESERTNSGQGGTEEH